MRIKRIAQAVGTMALAPALVLGLSTAAHADGDVHWIHKNDDKALKVTWAHDHPDRLTVSGGNSDIWTDWHDVAQSDGSWLEKSQVDLNYCMTAYYDHDVYMERCSGNNFQRWDEVNTGNGWKLVNRQTHECLDSNGSSVYMHECNDGNKYQLWF
ncbi:RICIN domain-containing protein [Streptomyces orinoci]|uniref:Ricin-type beta-trefoil lectin domain protein n=1 Tax=Streptomyces orinoci TaxID=67339 RepID=A0ABV3JRV6_STRON|nr:ricin-type beta-trefoil lectin domain protein [Streptomyces orinoci]